MQLTKTQGVFTNPTAKAPPAKLLLAFEAAPFARLVELAGGKTSDGVAGNIVLDVKITAVDQRAALAIGSTNEVDRFNEMGLDVHELETAVVETALVEATADLAVGETAIVAPRAWRSSRTTRHP